MPWSQAALERYKMRNSLDGDLPGGFDGAGWDFFKMVWWLWPSTVGMLVAIIAFAYYLPSIAVLLGLAALVWFPFAYAIYRAIEWRWWMSGIRFGEIRFESKLGGQRSDRSLLVGDRLEPADFGCAVCVDDRRRWDCVWDLCESGRRGCRSGGAIVQSPLVIGLIVGGYLICALAFGVVVRIYLRRDVWARVVASTMVYNLAAADNVVARGETANALGEGFADGLDIGGF